MKTICVITSTRADYGILTPLIRRLREDASLELRLAATGAHLSPRHGATADEIRADGFLIHREIPILAEGDSPLSVSRTMANALVGFSAYCAEQPPDMAVALGDRYETAAACAALANARIPIAHLHGGETTEGALDECYRHSITKMAYLHFAAAEPYRRRIIQLGEAPDRVFNVGSLGVENALNTRFLSREELSRDVGLDLSGAYASVTFHPATLDAGRAEDQCAELLAAMESFPHIKFLITKANADAGGQAVNAALEAYAGSRANCRLAASLGRVRYMSALKYASLVLGNSSSGLIEAPSFGVPTVNIGDRQAGRLRAAGVIDCAPESRAIRAAMERALSAGFQRIARQASNPYGSGDASGKILCILKRFLTGGGINLKKKFFDMDCGAIP